MKKIIILFAIMLFSINIKAQAPQKMTYQAVIRNSNNQLAQLQEIGMQISILQGSATGTAVYVERHFPKTNENGLVTIEIGSGTVVNGDFSAIDWSAGPYFLKTETDLRGGSNYTISGTTQLLSVPYALYAKTAENLQGGIVETDPVFSKSVAADIKQSDITKWHNKQGPMAAGSGIEFHKNKMGITTVSEKHYKIGDFAHDGVVFYVDESGEHGLVVYFKEGDFAWSKVYTRTYATGQHIYAGQMNTNQIRAFVAATGASIQDYPLLVDDFNISNSSFGDWYVPSIRELVLMNYNLNAINATLKAHYGDIIQKETYWSSSEYDSKYAETFSFLHNVIYVRTDKKEEHYVRLVRRF